MAQWYDKYLSVYGKPFSEVPQDVVDGTRERLANLQSDKPLASIVVIAYNEESHLQACLWAISEIVCKYPVEIIGVNNDSKDRTAEIFERSGIPVAVSATWTYFPDEKHGKLGLKLFELCRDLFLYVQHFKRPELSVRGLVFAYNADYGRKEEYRVDIIRGEDGSMALSLKKYGKIKFVRDRRCRAITGYGTIGNQSLWQSFVQHVKIQGKGITRIFFKKDHYEDSDENLVKPKS